jgi:hypothetical protein
MRLGEGLDLSSSTLSTYRVWVTLARSRGHGKAARRARSQAAL